LNYIVQKECHDQHANPKKVDTFGSGYKMSVHTAIDSLYEEVLQKYLDTLGPQADVHIISRDIKFGQTPLHVAASRGKARAIAWLLEHGADINPQDLYNATPLLRAAQHDNFIVVKLLLDRGASLDLSDRLDRTAPDMVTDRRHFNPEIASMLIKRGATIGKQADVLPKLLDWACKHGDLDHTKCLIEHGVSFQTKSAGDALTLYRRAKRAGHDEVAEYILAKTEEYRQSHSSKASCDRISKLDCHTKPLSCIEDAVADAHSGAPVVDPGSSAPVLSNNNVEHPLETGETAMAESHVATAQDSFRDVLADLSSRERYVLAVVIVLSALLLAQWYREV
jgi:ankyrin repeat protein